MVEQMAGFPADWRTRWLMFGEFFQDLPLAEFGEQVRRMGITAVDLPIRPDSLITPAQAETDLPRAAQTLATVGIRIAKLTTNIRDAYHPHTRPILQTARALGITHYQIGSWLYRNFGDLRPLRHEIRARLRDLAALNAELGLCGLIQNHSCEQFGANLADLGFVLQDIPPQHVGIYYDPAHATIEGGGQGWLMSLDLIADHIAALGVKDYRWVMGNQRHCGGQRRQSAEFCPLGDGHTPWTELLPLLRRIGFAGPVVFFGEYRDENCFAILDAAAALNQTAADIHTFEGFMAS
ncbi:MAG: sugar phosphate isomerase/epimerase [Anaerolineales bacterium]|nr:sugar phosphate isomerase/epimerase [Anaerolineales bacterium]